MRTQSEIRLRVWYSTCSGQGDTLCEEPSAGYGIAKVARPYPILGALSLLQRVNASDFEHCN